MRSAGALATLALHLAALCAILSYEPARTALASAAPIMVSLLTPEPPRPVEIAPQPKPRPKPRPRPVVKPPPLATPAPPVTLAETAPAPLVVPPPPPPAQSPEPVAAVAAPPPVVVTAPVFDAAYLNNPPPAYPTLSRRRGEQGRVVLRVRVDPHGKAGEVQVRESSGHERLDAAATDCVRGWRFVPARRGEEPVAAWVLIPISFRLEG